MQPVEQPAASMRGRIVDFNRLFIRGMLVSRGKPAFVRRRTSEGERIGARNFHNFSRGDNNRVLLGSHSIPPRREEQCSPTAKWFVPPFSLLSPLHYLTFSLSHHHILDLLCVFRCNHLPCLSNTTAFYSVD